MEIKTFNFRNLSYRQVSGTAMETKRAPVYVTLVLGYPEETIYDKVETYLNDLS